MKVLTLHQPYASLIALGVKTIETRPNKTNIRGRIAIHAAAKPVRHGALIAGGMTCRQDQNRLLLRGKRDGGVYDMLAGGTWFDLPLGAIVATADLYDCLPMVAEMEWGEEAQMGHDGALIICAPYSRSVPAYRRPELVAFRDPGTDPGIDVSDQIPYGHFAPARLAWLLRDIEPLDVPVPFKGGQGWSRSWEAA